MPKKKARKLTNKQEGFARSVAAGMSLTEAYQENYNAANMSRHVIQNEASHLFCNNEKVKKLIDSLKQKVDSKVVTLMVNDREKVLDKLRILMDTEKSGGHITAQLRAAELLGKSCALFKDVQVQEEATDTASIQAELEAALDAIGETKH